MSIFNIVYYNLFTFIQLTYCIATKTASLPFYTSCCHTLIGIILQFKNIHAAIYINKHNKIQAINIKIHGTWRTISKYNAHIIRIYTTLAKLLQAFCLANERVIASHIDFLLQFVKFILFPKKYMLY